MKMNQNRVVASIAVINKTEVVYQAETLPAHYNFTSVGNTAPNRPGYLSSE